MLEQMIDIFGAEVALNAQAIGITTNGVVMPNGNAVMGAGVARQAKDTWSWIPAALGHMLQEHGNHVHFLGNESVDYSQAWDISEGKLDNSFAIFSFPTKHHWKNFSSLELVETSARELFQLANEQNWTRNIYLPRPGCGLGGLSWKTVQPVISRLLDDRFIITSL